MGITISSEMEEKSAKKCYKGINSLGLLTMTFKKGQSGNPQGRALDKEFRDALRISAYEDASAEMPKVSVKGRNRLRAAADALMIKAMLGDVPAIKEVADRLDGKVPQPKEHSGKDGEAIQHNFKIKFVE